MDDTTDDVAFEAWVSSEPWWNTPPGQGGNETDEFNTLLPICDSPEAEDPACIISTSGIFAADGTTRIVGANDFSAWTTQIAGGEMRSLTPLLILRRPRRLIAQALPFRLGALSALRSAGQQRDRCLVETSHMARELAKSIY